MRASRTVRTLAAAVPLAAVLAAAAAPAGAAKEAVPSFNTGNVAHVSGSTAQLQGSVTPLKLATGAYAATSYAFEYGPTTAYGTKTKLTPVPPPVAPAKSVKVGQTVTGFLLGSHYRIVGYYTNEKGELKGPFYGKDKSYVNKKLSQLHFSIGKKREAQVTTVYGGSAELGGSLLGSGNEKRAISLEATPFPFTSPFTSLSGTVLTARGGAFTFQVAHLTQNTEFRFVAAASLPLISRTVLVQVTPKITLHARRGGKTALFRLYGTVQPARNGATVQIQQLLPQKAGSKKEGPRAHSVATTTLKHAGGGKSRYSVIVKLDGNYRYRAFVRLPKGPLASGHGANVLIKAPKAAPKTKTKHG
jgi:hypothetical protein